MSTAGDAVDTVYIDSPRARFSPRAQILPREMETLEGNVMGRVVFRAERAALLPLP